jgi:hypothetical protein
MTTFDSLNSLTKISSNSFRTNHDRLSELFGHVYILIILIDCIQIFSKKKLCEKYSSMEYIAVVLRGGVNYGLKPVYSEPRNYPRNPFDWEKAQTSKTLYLVRHPIRGKLRNAVTTSGRAGCACMTNLYLHSAEQQMSHCNVTL